MKRIKTLSCIAALALVGGCASHQTGDEVSSSGEQKDAACCKAGASEGKSCCSEAGSCSEKKADTAGQKN